MSGTGRPRKLKMPATSVGARGMTVDLDERQHLDDARGLDGVLLAGHFEQQVEHVTPRPA